MKPFIDFLLRGLFKKTPLLKFLSKRLQQIFYFEVLLEHLACNASEFNLEFTLEDTPEISRRMPKQKLSWVS